MDRKSWPWKKKSSEKSVTVTEALDQHQENGKKPSYIQISFDQYSHFNALKDEVHKYEGQVTNLEDQIKDLDSKLSTANAEIAAKEVLVKQHSKVAEEAVTGWEKAEAEASALKTHLETVTLAKLTVEDRAAHLDGALKECMRQIRSLKEENEQKLHDVISTKTNQMDKLRDEFESKIGEFEQELLRSAAENDALSRSLQERSNMLMRISEEKSQAEAEIEHLKNSIESCEREINTLKYETHVITKELEIRNEEKNMSMRSAEAANKQHLEGVKKTAKLEAECQRLRTLVRKKLPGPAALAQMKLEVESLGRGEYGDHRQRRSPARPSSPLMSPMSHQMSEFSLDKFHKENDLLTERLLAMEEETKMLKEALAKRNSELQVSRNLCAKTANRLQTLEAQVMSKTSPTKSGFDIFSHQNASNPPSMASMSEDGNEDARSLMSELSQTNKKTHSHKDKKSEASILQMASFSYFQHYPHSLLDPLLFSSPNSSTKLSGFIDQNPLYPPPNISTIVDTSLNPFLDSFNVEKTESSDVKKHINTNATAALTSDQLSPGPSAGKKQRRKTRNGSKSKEGVEGRKSKKPRNGSSSDVKEKRANEQEPPKDYIHVRARRGQATDSHSLAERARREKISERMRTLQNLVPGCDKVTGKALMLDEIINYVQSLQNQVEFLSMKLASISPVVYDFGSDLDGIIVRPEIGSADVGTSFANAMPTTTTNFSSLLDDSIIPAEAHLQEDGGEREKIVDRSGFNNNSFCSFS